MTDDEIKPEMKILVEYEGTLRPAKVIGARREKTGNGPSKIIGWTVHIEPTGLPYSTTADKIHSRR
jgi:hypothetical protein